MGTSLFGVLVFFFCCKVDKHSKILIKTSNAVKYIEWILKTLSREEHMILSSSMYENTHLHGSLERVLKTIHVSSF